jgi:hypothetical protein
MNEWGTWRAVVGVLLVVSGLVVVGLEIVTLLISHVLLYIVHVSGGVVARLTSRHSDHRLDGLGKHDVGLSSSTEDAEDYKEDDGEDDGTNGIINPGVVVIEIITVVY